MARNPAHERPVTDHPVYGPNKLKLGIFSQNTSGGCAISTAEGVMEVDWAKNVSLARFADDIGFELLVPVGRWAGFGGETNFSLESYETYTWAAGVGQATSNIGVMTTSHVPVIHPMMAAKQAMTIDHITGGRFGLNIVCGWSAPEMEMFGASMLEHDTRYQYAAEWVEIVKLLWTQEEPVTYEGKFLRVKNAVSMPKPIQKPTPPLMNAGGSPAGKRFCAQHCDLAFLLLDPDSIEGTRDRISAYRDFAREEFGRDLQIWAYGYVVQGDTQKDADDLLHYYAVEKGDDVAVQNLCHQLGIDKMITDPAAYDRFKYHFKAGYGGYPLVGTAERIAGLLEKVADAGLNGLALSWLDYHEGIERFNKEVMPLLRQNGLRVV
jgi:alkanesulfonate monooxygenase SsuD/methylene tetrahydromethanopterin reductase-like flavin-dependent oxidoreductase (luciferase family)